MQKSVYNITILKRVFDLLPKKLKSYFNNLHNSFNNNQLCFSHNCQKEVENNPEKLVIKQTIDRIIFIYSLVYHKKNQ